MRDLTLGMANETVAEVKEGLQEGDVVVLNPSVLLSDKEKVQYGVSAQNNQSGRGGPGAGQGGRGMGKGGRGKGKGGRGKGPGGPGPACRAADRAVKAGAAAPKGKTSANP